MKFDTPRKNSAPPRILVHSVIAMILDSNGITDVRGALAALLTGVSTDHYAGLVLDVIEAGYGTRELTDIQWAVLITRVAAESERLLEGSDLEYR